MRRQDRTGSRIERSPSRPSSAPRAAVRRCAGGAIEPWSHSGMVTCDTATLGAPCGRSWSGLVALLVLGAMTGPASAKISRGLGGRRLIADSTDRNLEETTRVQLASDGLRRLAKLRNVELQRILARPEAPPHIPHPQMVPLALHQGSDRGRSCRGVCDRASDHRATYKDTTGERATPRRPPMT
jgi:hypothetical protein